MMIDLIDRQAAIDAITALDEYENIDISTNEVRELLRDLPSAEPRKGKWVRNIHDKIICNQCGMFGNNEWNFCPNCGADMRGEEDA